MSVPPPTVPDTPIHRFHKDLVLAPLGEVILLLSIGSIGLLIHQPLIFAALGPTAFELVETPQRRSARPWNILVGHTVAVAAGFFALHVTRAWTAPAVNDHDPLVFARLAAGAIAVLLTVFFTLLLRAMQPAALSTSLIIALGSMQRRQDAALILAAVLLMTLLGEPIRRWRLRSSPSYTEADFARELVAPATAPAKPGTLAP